MAHKLHVEWFSWAWGISQRKHKPKIKFLIHKLKQLKKKLSYWSSYRPFPQMLIDLQPQKRRQSKISTKSIRRESLMIFCKFLIVTCHHQEQERRQKQLLIELRMLLILCFSKLKKLKRLRSRIVIKIKNMWPLLPTNPKAAMISLANFSSMKKCVLFSMKKTLWL